MDIFGIGAEKFDPGRIRFDALGETIESSEGQLHFVGGENADGFEGFCPRAVYGDFVGQQPFIEREGALEGVEVRVRRGFEAASPEAIVFARGGGHLVSIWSAASSPSRRALRVNRRTPKTTVCRFLLWLWGAPLPGARKD